MVVRVLKPIWHEKPETARRLRMRIETIIDYAIARKVFNGENPATVGPIKLLLGRQTDVVKQQDAIPYQKIHEFVQTLRLRGGVGTLALEFVTLAATRCGETRKAEWNEIDRKPKVWNIPADHRKGELPNGVADGPRCRDFRYLGAA